MTRWPAWVQCLCWVAWSTAQGAPEYAPRPVRLWGNFRAVGSESMNNEFALWAGEFSKYYPHVEITVEGKGSATAPPALLSRSASMGPMSRPMRSDEVRSFQRVYRYSPTAVATSIDVLALFVHRDNPLESIRLDELDAMVSKTRRRGYPRALSTWGDLGLTGPWAHRAIQVYGRNSASGTYVTFKDLVLKGGDFQDRVKEQPGSAAIAQAVANDIAGIGYAGAGYVTQGVKTLALRQEDGSLVWPSAATAQDGRYALCRELLIYLNRPPGADLPPAISEFLSFVLSRRGQVAVVKNGSVPLSDDRLRQERKALGLLP